jgi:hypothetical protein
LLQPLEQPLENPTAERRSSAHAFSAGDQHAT